MAYSVDNIVSSQHPEQAGTTGLVCLLSPGLIPIKSELFVRQIKLGFPKPKDCLVKSI